MSPEPYSYVIKAKFSKEIVHYDAIKSRSLTQIPYFIMLDLVQFKINYSWSLSNGKLFLHAFIHAETKKFRL